MDGVDISHCSVGDVIDVSPHDAALLIAEGWASRVELPRRNQDRRAEAADVDPPSRRRKNHA
jgi:hypothetical protein